MSTPLIEYGKQGRTLTDVPVIDVHAHVEGFRTCPSPGLDTHVKEMDRVGLDCAIFSSTSAIYGDVVAGNDEVLDAIERFPGRIYGYCFVTARYPELIVPELERCFKNPGFKGIKAYQVGVDYDDPRFDPAWEFAAANNVPILAHTWGGNLTGFDRAAERFPEATFIPAHTGSGFTYKPYIDAAKRIPNICLDLTYSREHTNMIETIVNELGADRIVWGSDAPCFSMSHQIGKILFARISDDDKRKILHDNAAMLYKLP